MYYLYGNVCTGPTGAAMATPRCVPVQPLYCPSARRAVVSTPVRCSSSPAEVPPPVRRSANYRPNFWSYGSMESLAAVKQHDNNLVGSFSFNKLKDHVRHLLLGEVEPLPKLRAIDTLQRLGVAYHFDEEITGVLNSISVEGHVQVDSRDDVHFMTLLFRLLRQNNYLTSPDLLLKSLKDGAGEFKKSLQYDTKNLLSLYEASHLAFVGEDPLDEARTFSTEALRKRMPSMDPHLRSSVENALAVPLHWAVPRLQARWFINHYAGDIEADPLMLHFAKLDFNKVQNLHQQGLARITRWWMNANLNGKLPFARDRLTECFYFATGVAPEPSHGACREVVAKVSALVVLLDDIYDIYGTLDELVMFTDAIERWDATASEELPEYMKSIYLTIINTSNEVAEHVLKQDGHVWFLLKKAWHDLCKAFLLEAKWHHNNYKPTLQEYLDNGWVSVSGPLILLHAFPMLKMDNITPNSIKQLESYPELVQMVSKIFRLCNDSATHSEELKRGDAPSSIAIYMFENRATEHEARQAVRDLTMETWKLVNQDAYSSNCHYPLPFANACVNLARISHCIYQGGDGISAPDDEKKREISKLFLEPFEIENESAHATSYLSHSVSRGLWRNGVKMHFV